MKIKTKESKVRELLTKHPKTRSNDKYLLACIWWNELPSKDISMRAFLEGLAQDQYSNPESIRRCRQKVQEISPELRGDNYRGRQKEEVVVKEEILKWEQNPHETI